MEVKGILGAECAAADPNAVTGQRVKSMGAFGGPGEHQELLLCSLTTRASQEPSVTSHFLFFKHAAIDCVMWIKSSFAMRL